LENVKNGVFNAGVVFDSINYCLHKDGSSQQIFLSTDDEDPNKLNGLGMIDGKVTKIILKKKSDSDRKMKFKFSDQEEEIWNAKIEDFNIYLTEE